MGKLGRFDFFVIVFALLVLVNLLITNDYTVLWDGAEAYTIFQMLKGDWYGFWPTVFIGMGGKEINLFAFRFPNVWFFILSLYGIYFYAKSLFGKRTAVLSLLYSCHNV